MACGGVFVCVSVGCFVLIDSPGIGRGFLLVGFGSVEVGAVLFIGIISQFSPVSLGMLSGKNLMFLYVLITRDSRVLW